MATTDDAGRVRVSSLGNIYRDSVGCVLRLGDATEWLESIGDGMYLELARMLVTWATFFLVVECLMWVI